MEALDHIRRALARVPGLGILAAVLTLFGGFLWMIVANIVVGVVAIALNGTLPPPDDMAALMPGWLMSAGYFMSVGGAVALGAGVVWLLGWSLVRALGLARPPWRALAAALVAGATVGWLPGWVAERLPEAWSLGALDMISGLLTKGTPLDIAAMVLAVTVGAPLLEELLFRGVLWGALDRHLPTWLVLVLTSVFFAAWHLDPVQGLAVLFTGLVLGGLRWASGSVWPSVLAHLVNNTLATVGTATTAEPDVPLWAALLAATASVGLVFLARRTRPAAATD